MNDYVVVTLNPARTMDAKHKVVEVGILRTCHCDEYAVIKLEGRIVDNCYSFEEALEAVKEYEEN